MGPVVAGVIGEVDDLTVGVHLERPCHVNRPSAGQTSVPRAKLAVLVHDIIKLRTEFSILHHHVGVAALFKRFAPPDPRAVGHFRLATVIHTGMPARFPVVRPAAVVDEDWGGAGDDVVGVGGGDGEVVHVAGVGVGAYGLHGSGAPVGAKQAGDAGDEVGGIGPLRGRGVPEGVVGG